MKDVLIIMIAVIVLMLAGRDVAYGSERSDCTCGTAIQKNELSKISPEGVEVDNEICPIMGEEIAEGEGAKVEYDGKIYNLCCPACIEIFNKDPEKYAGKFEEMLEKENETETDSCIEMDVCSE